MELSTKQIKSLWASSTKEHEQQDRREDYYEGKQKNCLLPDRSDGAKTPNLVNNFIRSTTDQHQGFITGIPVKITSINPTEQPAILNLDQINKYNNIDVLNSEHVKTAILSGKSIEIHSYDPISGQIEINQDDPQNWHIVSDQDGEVQLAIYKAVIPAGTIVSGQITDKKLTIWRVYDEISIKEYQENSKAELILVQDIPHYYGRPPIVIMKLNKCGDSMFNDAVLGLQDAYNASISSWMNDIINVTNSMLVFTGVNMEALLQPADIDNPNGDTKLRQMIVNRAAALPGQNVDAKYIYATNDYQSIVAHLKESRDNIFESLATPDFSHIMGNGAEKSGIAIKLAFAGILQKTTEEIRYLQQSISQRIDLINCIWGYIQMPQLVDYEIVISQNMPDVGINYVKPEQSIDSGGVEKDTATEDLIMSNDTNTTNGPSDPMVAEPPNSMMGSILSK